MRSSKLEILYIYEFFSIDKNPERVDKILEWILHAITKKRSNLQKIYKFHRKSGSTAFLCCRRNLGVGATSNVVSVILLDSATPKEIDLKDPDSYAVKLIKDPIDLEQEMKIYDILNSKVEIDCIPKLCGHVTDPDDREERKLGIVLPLGYPINLGIFPSRTLSLDGLKNHFLDLVEGLSLVHNQAQIIHRDIRPENLVILKDKKQVAFIDWGYSVQLTDGEYVGPYSGTLKTASNSVLNQLQNSYDNVIVRPKDDMESLVKTYFLLRLRSVGRDIEGNVASELLKSWNELPEFRGFESMIGSDFSNIEGIKNIFKEPERTTKYPYAIIDK